MTSDHLKRLLSTSERHLMGLDEHALRLPQAAHLLVREFTRAVTEGPQAMLSSPESMRDQQMTLAQVVERLLEDEDGLVDDLLEEIRAGTKEDVIEFLANTYAAWVIRSYNPEAFK